MRKTILVILIIMIFLTACAPPPIPQEEEREEPVIILEEPEDPFGDAPLKTFAMRAFRFSFDPDVIEVEEGDHVRITVSSLDVGHGFALPDFGINQKIPPEDSITIDFLADRTGEFEFFSSVYSGKGYKNMTGTFIVLPKEDMKTDQTSG